MPNWVENFVNFSGSEEAMQRLRETFNNSEEIFDFNKVIPMSEELAIECSSFLSNGMSIISGNITHEEAKKFKALAKNSPGKLTKMLELGKQGLSNREKHGAATWYGWCNENWGTKWNACHVNFNGDKDRWTGVNFDTAWSDPEPVIEELARQFPELTIVHEFIEEQLTEYVGRRVYEQGYLIDEYIPFGELEVIELLFKIKPSLKEDFIHYDGVLYDKELNKDKFYYIDNEYVLKEGVDPIW